MMGRLSRKYSKVKSHIDDSEMERRKREERNRERGLERVWWFWG
jgi:hypothetical protein